MFGGYVCGYSGEKSLPVTPVRGMTLSAPWSLQGPMAAGIKQTKNNEREKRKVVNVELGHVPTSYPGSSRRSKWRFGDDPGKQQRHCHAIVASLL